MRISSGGVYKRGNVFWYTIRIDGKRVQKSLETSSRSEAYRKFAELKEKLEIGITPTVLYSINFTDLKKRYLSHSQSKKAGSSYRRDKGVLEKAAEIFGKYPVAQIKQERIEKYLEERAGKGKKPGTLNRELAVFKHFFNKAKEWGIIKENPAMDIKPLKVQKKAIRYLSDDEIRDILKKADGIWKSIIITLLETGLRVGELTRLAWKDIDKEKRILAIHQTKSYKPRYIEISSRLMTVLEGVPKKEVRVYPFKKDYITRKVAKICEDAGLPDVTCHIFRHTFASRLVMAGLNLRTVQALLGHSDIKTTMVYSHLAPDYLQGIGEKLGYRY